QKLTLYTTVRRESERSDPWSRRAAVSAGEAVITTDILQNVAEAPVHFTARPPPCAVGVYHVVIESLELEGHHTTTSHSRCLPRKPVRSTARALALLTPQGADAEPPR